LSEIHLDCSAASENVQLHFGGSLLWRGGILEGDNCSQLQLISGKEESTQCSGICKGLSNCCLWDSRTKLVNLRGLVGLASGAAVSSASSGALNYHTIKLF